MSASTQLLTDAKSIITNGPAAVTKANSIAAAGPIMDYVGLSQSVLTNLQGADVLLNKVKTDTDGSDANLTNINAILAALEGTSSPSSTLITAINTVITAGPSAASKALAIAAAGPIMDYNANLHSVRRMLQESYNKLNAMKTNTDSSTDSTNLALINSLLLALS